jgi:signal transduction histidine kinase
MRVRLVSNDPSLSRVCREALLPLDDRHWDFGTVSTWEPGLDADIWIWDCDGNEQCPSESWLQEEHKIIFIVDRSRIVFFRDLLPIEAARILLKPVRPGLLQDFLQRMIAEAAPSPSNANDPSSADRMRVERDLLLQHLLEANLKLQEYEQDRTGFLARAAHDLRAPLVAISGYCGMLFDRQLGPLNEGQLTALQKMQHSVRRMTRLANGMLQISMGCPLESETATKVGDIHALIQRAIDEVRPVAESKQLNLKADVTPPPEPLHFEPWQIEQVLVNLLDNACRLTRRGEIVQVKAFPTFWNRRAAHVTEAHSSGERRSNQIQTPNAYRVEVHNTLHGVRDGGPRRAPEESNAGSVHNGSVRAGLGLAICREIISAHKGLVSTDTGPHGASFGFLLPLMQERTNRSARALHRMKSA